MQNECRTKSYIKGINRRVEPPVTRWPHSQTRTCRFPGSSSSGGRLASNTGLHRSQNWSSSFHARMKSDPTIPRLRSTLPASARFSPYGRAHGHQPPHSPKPVRVLTVSNAAGAKANPRQHSHHVTSCTEPRMNDFIFNQCVRLLEWAARKFGTTYNAINVWIFLRHLAGHHDRVDHCGDCLVAKSRRASPSVILEARSSHHRRRRRAGDSPGTGQPSRSGAAVTDVPVPRFQNRHRCRIWSIAKLRERARFGVLMENPLQRRWGLFPTIGNCGQKSRRRPMRDLPMRVTSAG